MQWTDANQAEWKEYLANGEMLSPRPETGVCFESSCKRYRVAASSLHVPAAARTWTVWDMTGAAPMAMMRDFKDNTSAMRAAEAMAESRGFRVALRLAAIGRAVWAGVRRLTA
jgi:hypothetical protein